MFLPAAEQLREAGHGATLLATCNATTAADSADARLKDFLAEALGHEPETDETRLVVSVPHMPASDSFDAWLEVSVGGRMWGCQRGPSSAQACVRIRIASFLFFFFSCNQTPLPTLAHTPQAAVQPAAPPPPPESGHPQLEDTFNSSPAPVQQVLMDAIGNYAAVKWQASQAPLASKLMQEAHLLTHIKAIHVSALPSCLLRTVLRAGLRLLTAPLLLFGPFAGRLLHGRRAHHVHVLRDAVLGGVCWRDGPVQQPASRSSSR